MRAPLRPRHLSVLAVVSAFALAASGTHLVDSGDTLSQIAERNGTSVTSLVEANGIADADLIVVGQQITVPGAAGDQDAGAQANGDDARENATQLPGRRHTVVAGDTIAGIADRYGIAEDDLIRWNGLSDGNLYATTRLVLYDPGSLPTVGSGGPQSHTVARGDTVGGIAASYGTTSEAIAEASGLSDVHSIRVGQELTIPGSSGVAARCPVPGATFFNDWGFPRSGGRSHAGIDMFAPRGTPVYAPVSGWVDVAKGEIGGHQFRLRGGDGTLWFGSHLDRFGDHGQVQAGDVIGYVGDSGNAKGSRPHVHFEVHPGSEAVNPYPLLRTIC